MSTNRLRLNPSKTQFISLQQRISYHIISLVWRSLNPSKTQFIWFGTLQQLVKLDPSAITADFPHFIFSPVVRDLGVTLDQELIFIPHIHRLCRDSYYQLRQLRTVVCSLNSDATATLIHAFITARLDNYSSLYAGLPVVRLQCLDRVLRSLWAHP